jgi:hypothetical protein
METFITVKPEEAFGINLNNAHSVRSYATKLHNDKNEYARYLLTKMGFRIALAKVGSILYKLLESWITVYKQSNFVCSMLHFEFEAY